MKEPLGFDVASQMNSMNVKTGKTYCAYCGAEYPLDDDAATLVSEHIKTCEKHPMRAVEARAAELQAALTAAINMNIEKNAEVARLTAELAAANEDAERLDKLVMDAVCRQTSEIDTNAGLDAHRAHRARVGGGNK